MKSGKLLIETGKGSFRVSSIFAAGDLVILTDKRESRARLLA